jgi:hypothetical protein
MATSDTEELETRGYAVGSGTDIEGSGRVTSSS